MTTLLPTDANDNLIPAMRLRSSGSHTISALTSGSARTSTAFNTGTRVVSLYATGPVFLKFGDETVTASNSDHYYPTGVYYDFAIGGDEVDQYTHVVALAADADCTLYISEKE